VSNARAKGFVDKPLATGEIRRKMGPNIIALGGAMTFAHRFSMLVLASLCAAVHAFPADYPQPREASWIAKDFRFSTGDVFPELRIAYTTVGAPGGEPVLLLHGTTGSAASLLNKDFAGELFGPGQPPNMQRHLLTYALATIGGNVALFKQAPDYKAGDALIAKRLAAPFRGDANDTLYQWESSADYDPSSGLDKITASVVAINAIDDERNPPELGVMEAAMKRLQNGRYVLLPLGPDSRGHGTTGQAKLWKQYLAELLQTAPRK
jgi:homoserine acetyltransferase